MEFKKLKTAILLTLLVSWSILLEKVANANDAEHSYQILIQPEDSLSMENAQLHVELYGIASGLADAPASLLSETIVPLEKSPYLVTLPWPSDSQEKIFHSTKPNKREAIYYLSISVDINSDGRICQGDFRQNYNKTPFFSFSEKPSQTLTFHISPISDNRCKRSG